MIRLLLLKRYIYFNIVFLLSFLFFLADKSLAVGLLFLSLFLIPCALIKPNLAFPFVENISRKKAMGLLITTLIVSALFLPSKYDNKQHEGDAVHSASIINNKKVKSAAIKISPTMQPTVKPSNTIMPTPTTTLFLVTKVVDGDTIELENGSRVRYIGIDTPETGVCYASQATQKNKELVLNKKVTLVKDVSETDRYGRLLRYVYIADIFVNDYLVRNGYANATSYPPDVKFQEQFKTAEQEARSNTRGFWNNNVCEKPTQEPTQKPIPTTVTYPTEGIQNVSSTSETNNTSSGSCKYDCSGPDKDCADFSTHAEAQAFFNCCGFTANYDPMRLDSIGVGDGVACESLP